MKIFNFFVLIFSIFSLASADFTSTSFEIENPINFLGGGESASSSFQYISTTGQLTQGQSESLNFAQNAGFLYFPDVGLVTPPPPGGGGGVSKVMVEEKCGKFTDLNCDGFVNIKDLSILLYYFTHPTDRMDFYDLSPDGTLDIKDISVMFYYWNF